VHRCRANTDVSHASLMHALDESPQAFLIAFLHRCVVSQAGRYIGAASHPLTAVRPRPRVALTAAVRVYCARTAPLSKEEVQKLRADNQSKCVVVPAPSPRALASPPNPSHRTEGGEGRVGAV
jgi:hypothetical protein